MALELSEFVRAASGKRALVIGDLILDRYLYGDAERISPEAPVPVLKTVDRQEAMGGSANVAACLRALGCSVSCCGTTGKDPHSKTLQQLLKQIDIDVDGVVEQSDRLTTTKTRLVGLAQHRHRQQLLRVDQEDTRPLTSACASKLRDKALSLISTADVVCLEDYDKGVVTPDLVKAVVERARRTDIPVLADPARLSDYARYRGASAITPNRAELELACGQSFDSLAELAEAAQGLLESHDIDTMIATVDREGCVLVQRGQGWRHLPTVPRSVYDNTGAGDAVLAMLAAAAAGGADWFQAARLANTAGGLEVEKFGCVPISADEVLAELRLEDRAHNGKLRTLDELKAELSIRRDRGETIAFTNGCFDILHAGHVDFLKRCRAEASVLVVGLNSDSSVKLLNKGDDRPINHFADRAVVVGAMEHVDYVVGFEGPDPGSLIEQIRPDVLLKGQDWADKGVVGAEFVRSIGGRVVLLPLLEGRSTTKLIERLKFPTQAR